MVFSCRYDILSAILQQEGECKREKIKVKPRGEEEANALAI